MIARIIIPLILVIVLADLYADRQLRRRHPIWRRRWLRVVWWMPAAVMVAWSVALATVRHFVPDDITWVAAFLVAFIVLVVPKVLFAVCSVGARIIGRWGRGRQEDGVWPCLVAAVLTLVLWGVAAVGFTTGVSRLEVRRVDLYFDRLPAAFDGYRIVHFSDAHLGTLTARGTALLQRDIDSINAQRADLIVFTGDLQNMQPREIRPVASLLASLHAPDGVLSVLGNHDYSKYVDVTPAVAAANCAETVALQRQSGWRVLRNEHTVIRRGADSIVVAGEHNYGAPDHADFAKTMRGVGAQAFTVMLQHNPAAWRTTIAGTRRVALTLSGHTHGGQLSVRGWRPTRLTYTDDYGLYTHPSGSRLYVTAGVGGLVPFRFGIYPEIAVITLHKTRK